MTDTQVRFLLDAAPEVPEELLGAPLDAIRRRVRRRRAGRVAGIVLAVAVLTTGGVAVLRPGLARAPQFGNEAGPTADPIPWRIAVVDRSGMRLTLAGEGSLACSWVAGTVDRRQVTVTVSGWCPRATEGRVTVEFRLSEPLGGRAVVDGWDGTVRPVLAESEIPEVTYPAGLTQVSRGYSAGLDGWVQSYTRAGGPDVGLLVNRTAVRRSDAPVGLTEVHGHPAAIYQVGPGQGGMYYHLVTWTAGGWTFVLHVVPAEGQRADRATVQWVLNGLRWS